ncbi:hypothetical protein K435DRAFT_642365, partial [Dendrothele bispora CBS 962.96]
MPRRLAEDPAADGRVNLDAIKHIQQVIKDTSVPTWINSVPGNYSEKSAGTIKADEWRTLATIYLPIALVTLWDYNTRHTSPLSRKVLRHTMALFQAVNIVCRYTMSTRQATAYRELLKQWVDDLHHLHSHTKGRRLVRPNVHAAFHIYDFLMLFGPVVSWWTFPFERLIGTLQKINTNDHIGGEMEITILNSFLRGANFRRLV